MSFDLSLDLRDTCQRLRASDGLDVGLAEKGLEQLRAAHEVTTGWRAEGRPDGLDPAERELLWLAGWLAYEVSWHVTKKIEPAYGTLEDAVGELSRALAGIVFATGEVARGLPWPEYAPRALGAIRCEALAHSKADTVGAYDAAWLAHKAAKEKHDLAAKELVATDLDGSLALKEILEQLELSESGTSSRNAERLISRWTEIIDSEEIVADTGESDEDLEVRWCQRMYEDLLSGARSGARAFELVREIEQDSRGGFVEALDEDRMAVVTWLRQPAIMATRAYMLLLPLTVMLEEEGHPPVGHESWTTARSHYRAEFERLFRWAEDPETTDERDVAIDSDHERSVVQIRLAYALLHPGERLTAHSRDDAPQCLFFEEMSTEAVDAMAAWLIEREFDANAIGSAVMPKYLELVEKYRAGFQPSEPYVEWRRRYPKLDRYRNEPSRAQVVAAALG